MELPGCLLVEEEWRDDEGNLGILGHPLGTLGLGPGSDVVAHVTEGPRNEDWQSQLQVWTDGRLYVPIEAWRAAVPRPKLCQTCGHGRGPGGSRTCRAPENLPQAVDLVTGDYLFTWGSALAARRSEAACGARGVWWKSQGQVSGQQAYGPGGATVTVTTEKKLEDLGL